MKIVVPSHERPENAEKITKVLGTNIIIAIDKKEKKDYEPFIKEGVELFTYNKKRLGLDNIAKIREYLKNKIGTPLCFIDDDFQYIKNKIGSRQRSIKDKDKILKIISNGFQIAKDLNISLVAWDRLPNSMYLSPNDFITFTSFVAGAFIINKDYLHFDRRFALAEDIDLSLQALLKDRIIFIDRRFFFYFGGTAKGRGGNQKIRTQKLVNECDELLKNKWGSYIETGRRIKASAYQKNYFTQGKLIKVKRKSPLAIVR